MRRSSSPIARSGWRGARRSSGDLPCGGWRARCAGSRASQSETAILPSEAGSGARLCCSSTSRPAALHPLRHGLGREAEPAMGVLLAQEFEIVRREIDHQQPAARPQHARGLGDRARAVVEKVQHLMDDDDVERILRQREVVDVALAHAAMLAGPARSSRARASASMSSDRSRPRPRSIRGPEQLQHAAGAGAEIEQRAHRLARERRDDRLLDRVVGDVQLADAVPFGGMAAEIGLRGRGARGAHGGEPLAVARQRRVGGIEPRDQVARELGRRRPARPGGRTPRSLRGSARPGRLRRAAADGARCAAATGAGCR